MYKRFIWLVAVVVCVWSALALSGCGKPDRSARINGAGATFPYPVYGKWADKYKALTGVEVNYQPIGSGGGVQQIKAGTVDFGASDAPLTKEEMDEAGLTQFPMVMGGVVPVVNLPGVKAGELALSPEVLAAIYLGKITKWNDPAIVAETGMLVLPNKDITVVTRSDGSGTTWIFTNYLDKVSKAWHEKVGYGKAVDWPVGVSFKGNDGVAAQVKIIDGGIGYVEYAFALENDMTHVRLKNKAGNYVTASAKTFQAAARNADWKNAPGFHVILTDQPGADSWPISGATYIILRKEQKDAKLAKAILDFFDWCYRHGASTAKKLDYVPIPDDVIELVKSKWASEITADGKAIWK